jgi:hypothetical protein
MKQPQQWWVKRGENSSGPFTAKELKQAALEGQIKPESQVRLAGKNDWMLARDVAGLFAASAAISPSPNPYASPQAPAQPPVASPITRHWVVVHATAWVMIAVASLNLLSFAGTAVALLMGTIPSGEIDSPIGLLIAPLAAVLTIAGAIGALYRRRWGVGLLAVMTFLHCCIVMVFVIGDSFGACWRSFAAPAPLSS